MAFMKRDVNLGLLVLIIISIALFAGFSIYYQTSFKDVSLEYQSKLEQLSKVTSELRLQREKLNETSTLRVKAEEDRKVLDERYKDLNDERGRLEADKISLQSELTTTKSGLAEKKAELDATKNLLSQTQASLEASNSELSSLKSKRDNLEEDIERICAKLIAAGGSDNDC
jgi:chromosome segregation ATPase